MAVSPDHLAGLAERFLCGALNSRVGLAEPNNHGAAVKKRNPNRYRYLSGISHPRAVNEFPYQEISAMFAAASVIATNKGCGH